MCHGYSGKSVRARLRIILLGAAGLVLVSACVSLSETQRVAELGEAMQWPPAPQPARIKYLYTVSVPADANIEPGWLGKIWQLIKGGVDDRIATPMGVHVDADGRLYVVDSHYRAIHVFDTKNSKYYRFPKKSLDDFVYPVGITADDHGRVYVSDSSSHVVHIFADYGRKYLQAIGEEQLARPTGLALRPDSNELLVVDTLASNIVVFDTTEYGIRRIVGRDGTVADALHYPTSISVSADGSVYVTDSLNFRIQVLSPDLNFVSHFGEVGDGPGYFSRPKGVALDSDDHIYVVDALFDNVQIFDLTGNLLLTFGSPGHGVGELWLPNEIFIDARDRIYVSDAYNSRVQVFQYLSEDE